MHLKLTSLNVGSKSNYSNKVPEYHKHEYIFDTPNRDLSGIYHYEGSLTTPGCNEIVQFIVMDTPLYIKRNGLVS